MNIAPRSRLLLAAAALLAIMACNFGASPAAQAPMSTATAGLQHGIPISATPIQLTIPTGLATGATAATIDVVTDQTGAPWDVAPAHLQLTLSGYSVEISSLVPQILVYPAQQYASLNPAAAESLKRLEAFLANPSATYNKDTLPRAPFFNAGQVLAEQAHLVHFSGGSGVRFVTQYGQDVSPINNSGLFYLFQGLTDGGKYYVVAVLPVNLPFLPADNDPHSTVPTAGIPFPPSSASGSDFENYYQQIAGRIAGAPTGQFDPPLDQLDQLIESIAVNH
jgi:hypothetical protein